MTLREAIQALREYALAPRELSADTKLMNRVAAAKDARAQEQLLREHVHRIVCGETEPQAEKAAPEKAHMPPERRDEPRTLGG